MVHAVALAEDVGDALVKELLVGKAVLLQHLGIAADAGQRGLELVGDVVVEDLSVFRKALELVFVGVDGLHLLVDAVDHLGEVAREDAQLVPPLGARQAHDLAHVDLVLLDVLLQRLADARKLHDGRGDGAGKEHRDDQGDKADHHRDEGDGAHDVVSLGVEDGVVRDGADHADAVALDEDGVGEIGARPLRLRVQGEGGKAAARKADVAEVVLDEDRGIGRGEHLPIHGEGGRGVARRAGDLLHEVLGDGGKALLVVVLLAEDEHLLDVDQAVVLHRDKIVVDVALVALGNVLGDEEVHDQEHGKEDGQHVQRHLDTDGQADLRSARKEPLQGEGPRFPRRFLHLCTP